MFGQRVCPTLNLYSKSFMAEQIDSSTIVDIIKKPFNVSEISTTVTKHLDTKKGKSNY